ncbi:hypothetical protein Gpo141_00012665 [Globisporangium polare]
MAKTWTPRTESSVTSSLSEDPTAPTATATMTPRVHLSELQRQELRSTASEVVRKTLEHETHFRYRADETLDDKDWKLVRSKERLRVYKRTQTTTITNAAATTAESLLPMVLAVGCMEGKLEDALYGVHHKTTQEMRSVTSFLNKNHVDAAVLANIDQGTAEDPFRYLGLKWRVVQTPGGGKLIKNRDVCTLEHLGIDRDQSGNQYGFHLMKSVDLDDQLPVSSKGDVVRAQIMLCCIYRQVTPTLVGMYCKAIFDPSGDMMDFVGYFTAAEMVLGISKALDCAAAKRLTLLALRNNIEIPVVADSNWARQSRLTESSGVGKKKASSEVKDAACSVCLKKPFFLGLQLRKCELCSKSACAKCHIKTELFARPHNVKVVSCKACVLESRTLAIDPRQPHPELGAEIEGPSL